MGSVIICPHCGKVAATIEQPQTWPDEAMLKTPIEWDKLSPRTCNALRGADRYYEDWGEINTVEDLWRRSEGELMRLPGMGQRSVNEIKDFLADFGLKLGEGS